MAYASGWNLSELTNLGIREATRYLDEFRKLKATTQMDLVTAVGFPYMSKTAQRAYVRSLQRVMRPVDQKFVDEGWESLRRRKR